MVLRLVCDEVHLLDLVDRTVLELPAKPAESVPADSQPVDAATAGAITAAFETYLDGSISDVELRIDQVEDFDGMREAARETFERVGDSGAAARGRVDAISRTSSTTAPGHLFDPAERPGRLRRPTRRGRADRRPLVRVEGHLLRPTGPLPRRRNARRVLTPMLRPPSS